MPVKKPIDYNPPGYVPAALRPAASWLEPEPDPFASQFDDAPRAPADPLEVVVLEAPPRPRNGTSGSCERCAVPFSRVPW